MGSGGVSTCCLHLVPSVSASCQQQTALLPVLSPSFPPYRCDFTPVCFRLADRHTGPAAGGRGPHPPLLPPGAHLALLQLQESLLQAHSCHPLHCRYVEYSETTELSGKLHHNSQLETSTQAQNSTSPHDVQPWCIKAVSYDHCPLIFGRSSIKVPLNLKRKHVFYLAQHFLPML